MNFISLKFFIFFITLLVLLKQIKTLKFRYIILLIFSYIFYAAADFKFLFLLIFISCAMWFFGIKIDEFKNSKKYSKFLLILAITFNLFVLCYFKYSNFFIESLNKIFNFSNITTLKLILPLGISFYIFQSMSYVFDIYYKKIKAEKSIIKVLLYIGFFPQITAGPIIKANEFLPVLNNIKEITSQRFSYGMQLFALGIFKKLVIADRLAVCVNSVYDAPSAFNSTSLIIAVLSYSLQLYYDFSGYSDMAIGIAHILGFDYKPNFNLPYLAKNPSDFWRRWHISLSSWFRDYIYIPLGGSKKGQTRTYLNTLTVMTLCGFWHGAGLAFILWGLAHGILISVHKMFRNIMNKFSIKENGFINLISVIFTFTTVSVLWILFRTENVDDALLILKRILTNAQGINYVYVYTFIFAFLLILIEFTAYSKHDGNYFIKPMNLSKFSSKIIFCCLILIILAMAYVGESAFIYARF